MTDSAGDASGMRDRLDSVLRDLYDFGDDYATSKTNPCENRQQAGHTVEKESEKVSDSEEEQPTAVCSKRGKRRVSLFFESIKDELRGQPKSADFPDSSASKNHVEVVTFARRKKQTKGKEIKGRDSELDVGAAVEVNSETFNFEKARLEVHKFGITGYKKEKQRKFEQERAIMLGAKPPKREYVNYKVYQTKIKEQVQTQKEKSFKENGLEPVKKKRKPGQNGRSTRKPKGSAVVPSGQVGRFRNGALILSGKDIQKIKQSRVIK